MEPTMIPEFWLLEPASLAKMVQRNDKAGRIVCGADSGHTRADHPKVGELSVVAPRAVDDFVWSWRDDLMISKRALDVLRMQKVTGFEIRPVEVICMKRGRHISPELFELVVTGWGGAAGLSAGVHTTKFCRSCRHRVYTIAKPEMLIDPSAWDGSDFFIVWPAPRYRFASARLAAILRRAKLSGIKLVPAREIPMKPGSTLTPGPLSTWMPEDRALELSRHFDVL
jgi:hypothetical protein